ncbi:uncharacterized protein [Diadema antillarum]|uniref:uncharacterized protein n=1 Tax=Diadema antillarum TaxID=105358 RepID=UPI003A879A73
MKLVILALLALAVGIDAQTCDFSTGLSQEECAEYTDMGAIYVYFPDKEGAPLNSAEMDQFKAAMANISNEYVILEVEPEDIVVVAHGNNEETGQTLLQFFVLNPSGSTVMPVAFRSQELYLVIQLNNVDVDKMAGQEVNAQAPPSSYPLAVPAWGIAIMGYAGLVLLIYCAMVLTADWRRERAREFEEKLEKQYYESNNANGVDTMGKEIQMSKMNGNKYEVVTETKPKMTSTAVQTPRHVAVQVDPGDIGITALKQNVVEAVIENGYSSIDPPPPPAEAPPPELSHDYDSVDPPPSYSGGSTSNDTDQLVGDAGKDAEDTTGADAAAAIDGAVNEAFVGDGGDPEPSSGPSTSL